MEQDRTAGGGDDRRVVVGIDIGGTKTALLATEAATGCDVGSDAFPTPADAGVEAMRDALDEAIPALLRRSDREAADLAAIGVAAPGLVDASRGRVIVAGNLTGWRDLPLRDLVERRFGVPVFVEQDANAAALGEKWRGAGRKMNNFAFLALGTGIGVGLVINGRLHRGFHHAAGEVGNFVMGREFLGQRERDGIGNLARLVGGRTLRERAQDASGEAMSAAEAIDRGTEALAGDGDGDDLAPLAADAVEYVVMAVVTIGALLDPEAVILGGGTAEAGTALIDPVRDLVARELPAPPAIMQAVLGPDAQLHGAVFGALWQLDPGLAQREELR